MTVTRSINGIKQGPKLWNDGLQKHLLSVSFIVSLEDPCLYRKWYGNNLMILVLHVDDGALFYDAAFVDVETAEIMVILDSKYKLKQMDLNNGQFLGLRVTHSP